MGHTHFGVVYNMGKVIGWQAIAFYKNKVIQGFGASAELTHNGVMPGVALWIGDFKTQWLAAIPRWWVGWAVIAV